MAFLIETEICVFLSVVDVESIMDLCNTSEFSSQLITIHFL